MTTKYILHGGDAQEISPKNDPFFQEILSDFTSDVNILLVHFAAEAEKQEIYKQRDIAQFERAKGERKLTYQEASELDFENQIAWADVIYFGGGTTPKLLNTVKKFKGLVKRFEGKTVAGESAGANCLATYCYTKSGGGIMEGLGCVPVKIIPHYQPGDEMKLDNTPQELEMLLLPSYGFRVFIR